MWIITKYFNAWIQRNAYEQGLKSALDHKSSPHGILDFICDILGLPGFKEREQGYHDVVKYHTVMKTKNTDTKNSADQPKKPKQKHRQRKKHGPKYI